MYYDNVLISEDRKRMCVNITYDCGVFNTSEGVCDARVGLHATAAHLVNLYNIQYVGTCSIAHATYFIKYITIIYNIYCVLV